MANKINWVLIIGIAIVVAVVASLITGNIVGNVIKVQAKGSGTKIYTKAEIDSLIKKLETDRISTEVLDIRSLNNSIRFQATDVSSVTMNGKFIANDLISRNSLAADYVKTNYVATNTLQTALTGNGTAYACLDSRGILYRSLTTCR